MSNSFQRRTRRHELEASKQIPVVITRERHVDAQITDQDPDRKDQKRKDQKRKDQKRKDRKVKGQANKGDQPVQAKVVDISINGFKLISKTAFEFQEKFQVQFPSKDGNEIVVKAEVRWIEPNSNGRAWSVGCLIVDEFPPEYINEMAVDGILDRRSAVRHLIDQPALGRWELTQEEQPVQIVDVSAQGICLLVDKEAEIGKRIRIGLNDLSAITAKATWQTPTEDGYKIGCEVIEGSPFSILEDSFNHALLGAEEKMGRYQVLSFCGLSLFLVMLIREWFF